MTAFMAIDQEEITDLRIKRVCLLQFIIFSSNLVKYFVFVEIVWRVVFAISKVQINLWLNEEERLPMWLKLFCQIHIIICKWSTTHNDKCIVFRNAKFFTESFEIPGCLCSEARKIPKLYIGICWKIIMACFFCSNIHLCCSIVFRSQAENVGKIKVHYYSNVYRASHKVKLENITTTKLCMI